MKKLFVAVAFLTVSTAAFAANKAEIGFILGEPTGLSAKVWTFNNNAFDMALGWSFADETDLSLHADYLWHKWDMTHVRKGKMPVYFGIGAVVKFASEAVFGARFPIGLQYMFSGTPLNLFAEIAPILYLSPDTEFRIHAGVGMRYAF